MGDLKLSNMSVAKILFTTHFVRTFLKRAQPYLACTV